MAGKRLLVVYYSGAGSTRRMAEAIAEGARRRGVVVDAMRVEGCRLSDLVEADGIVVGSPTYFSNVAWQVKRLIDESIALYRRRELEGKVGGCFTSAGTRADGEDCLKMLELAFGKHHRMRIVPGVIRARGDDDEAVAETCRRYGEEVSQEFSRHD